MSCFFTSNAYDDLYRPIEKKRANLRLAGMEYDNADNQTADIDANGNRTEYAYTRRNQKEKATFADSTTRGYGYDGNGNLKTETDEEGIVTSHAYDRENRPTAIERAGELTQKSYNEMGLLAAEIRPEGNSRTFNYDKLKRMISVIDDPWGPNLTTRYEYDKNGNLTRTTGPRGNVVENTYDELNRKTSHTQRKASGNLVTGYEYDEEGNLARLTDAKLQVSTYVYDLLNRKTENHYGGLDITSSYDANNNLTSTSVAGTSSDSTTNTYDNFDRLKTSTQRGTAVSYTYDNNGNRLSVGTPTSTTGYSYDARNRVKTLTNSLNSAVISKFEYSYNRNGNRLGQDETRGTRNISTGYTYDSLDRMASYSVTENSATTRTDYTFDGYNRKTESTTKPDSSNITRTYSYDETDWLIQLQDGSKTITYSYDNNGNTIKKADSTALGSDIVFEYDARDKLTRTGKGATVLGTYTYNANGYRIRQNNSDRGDVEYFYDGTAVIEERNSAGLLAHYRYANKLYSLFDGTQNQYYHLDALGSTTDLTDDQGTTKASYFLNPWGMIVDSIGSSVNRRIFTGKENDQNTGLVYFGARYYDPDTARFITQDTYLGEQGTPPSLHRYLYAYSNPTVFIDLEGYSAWDVFKKIVAGGKKAWEGTKQAFTETLKALPVISLEVNKVPEQVANSFTPKTTSGQLFATALYTTGEFVASNVLAPITAAGSVEEARENPTKGSIAVAALSVMPDATRGTSKVVKKLFGKEITAGKELLTREARSGVADAAVANKFVPNKASTASGHYGETFQNILIDLRNADFSATKDGSVFWTGYAQGNQKAAMDWAKLNNKSTLEMTPGGQMLEKLDLYGPNSPVTEKEADHLWRAASAEFARSVSGEVNAFTAGTVFDRNKIFYGFVMPQSELDFQAA